MSYCAIIVSFNPNIDLIENIASLLGQVDEIIIVDNASGKNGKALLCKIPKNNHVNIIYNKSNVGVAAALNIGVKLAKSNKHEWVMTLDQDSQVTNGMIDFMINVYNTYPNKREVASLSPRFMTKNSGGAENNLIPSLAVNLPYQETNEVMTSGNLIKVCVFDSIGYFNEDLFIDYVDFEFCWRCVSQGYKILEIKEAVLLHSVGFPKEYDFFGKIITTMNHIALRRYYIARNTVYIFKNYIFKHPKLVMNHLFNFFKVLIKISIFETDRKNKLIATFLGFIDGLEGRMGKCTREI